MPKTKSIAQRRRLASANPSGAMSQQDAGRPRRAGARKPRLPSAAPESDNKGTGKAESQLDRLIAQAGSGKSGPEIVIGLVGAVGAQLTQACKAIQDALSEVDYLGVELTLLDLVKDQPEWALRAEHGADKAMRARMNCGNNCRRTLERNDALALFAIAEIQVLRTRAAGDAEKAIPRTAYILRSLKTPEEIKCLRLAYGDSCYIAAVYCPHEVRKQNLAKKIGESYHAERSHYFGQAEELIEWDMREAGETYGQNLRDSFPEADVFLDGTSGEALSTSTQRFVEIIFGHPFRTPTREEVGMFQAYGAKLRSAQAGRQVGAAIARDGDVVCIGTNEVAKSFGGQYWEGDKPDGRDHERADDSTQAMTRSLFADLLARLRAKGWLAHDKEVLSLKELLDTASEQRILRKMKVESDAPPSLAEKASLLDIIEFMRAVHAEMAALMNAARHGIPVDGCILYCTALPCHECARHIVAAGIKKVYFIEPYPKSRVAELFDDSIAIDGNDSRHVPFQAFTGIGPQLYSKMFVAVDRKDGHGHWIQWDQIKKDSAPRRFEQSLAVRELDWLEILNETLKRKQISIRNGNIKDV